MPSAVGMRFALWMVGGCLLSAQPAMGREWTDSQGNTVEAKFVRVNGTHAVLQAPGGRVLQTPLANLSPDDQAYIREQLRKEGVRVWTDRRGRQLQAQFVRMREADVFLKSKGKTSPAPFDSLSTADRIFVREELERRGESDRAPPAEPDETLGERRVWTDTAGQTVEGQFDCVLQDRRVFLAVDGETRVISMSRLSPEDHDYLREKLAGTPQARLVPMKIAPPPVQIAAVPPSSPPPMAMPRPPQYSPPPQYSAPPQYTPPPQPQYTPPPSPQYTRPQYTPPQYSSPGPQYQPPPQPQYQHPSQFQHPSQHQPPMQQPPPVQEHPSFNFQNSPPPGLQHQTMVCRKCYRPAPLGTKEGDPCPNCSKFGLSAYQIGRMAGLLVRYGGMASLLAFLAGWIWRKLSD